ncbi:MAG: hypothetical protein KGI56_06760 [Acidobacteriota bacterium]|nr:hypothetical protein [Acidobacteriota bacterium]
MRSLPLLLCAALLLGCTKSPSTSQRTAPASQFAEASLSYGPPPDPSKPQERPARLTCTVGLIPAYKYKDGAQLELWAFPGASAPRLTLATDLSDPSLQGHRVPIVEQSFSGEGVLLNFSAIWPGGPRDQVIVLDVMHHGRRFARVFGTPQ